MSKTYRVIDLRNIGNDKDGYEVNDAHYTGETVELESETIEEIINALKSIGRFTDAVRLGDVVKADDSEHDITLRGRTSGVWLYSLELVKSIDLVA